MPLIALEEFSANLRLHGLYEERKRRLGRIGTNSGSSKVQSLGQNQKTLQLSEPEVHLPSFRVIGLI
jgi:hypothetical protein